MNDMFDIEHRNQVNREIDNIISVCIIDDIVYVGEVMERAWKRFPNTHELDEIVSMKIAAHYTN